MTKQDSNQVEQSAAVEDTETLPKHESVIKKTPLSFQTKLKITLIAFATVAVILYLAWDVMFDGPIMQLLSNREQMVAAVDSLGVFGPLLYIILQIIQTVVAPIPGQVVGSIGGFLFGPWGILWTTIGSSIGAYIVFKISKRFGRPLLEKIFKKSIIQKFEFILDAKGASFVLFAIFLLPGLPDDLVCYLAGLTNVPIRRLMVLLILGHLPSIVVTNFFGDGASENLPMVIALGILTVIVLGIAVWQRERIIKLLKEAAKDPANSMKIVRKSASSHSKKEDKEP